jgi:hypothetical protein
MRFFSLNLIAAIGFLSSESFGEAVPSEDCTDIGDPILQDTIGNGDDFPYDESIVTITAQNIDEVTFSVSQIWNENGLPMVSVHFRTLDGEDQCSMQTNDDGSMIPFGEIGEFTAMCSHGYAEVSVYAYVGSEENFDVSECESCVAPDNNYVGYYLSLPCVPVCDPVIPDCISEPTVRLADIGHEDQCIYEENPIMTEAVGMNTDSVEFVISNTWGGETSALSVYFTNKNGEPECNLLENMDGFSATAPFEARCEHGMAEVVVQLHSTGIEHIASEIPEACNTPSNMGTCSYEFIVPCVSGEICFTEPPSSSPTPSPSHQDEPPTIDCTQLSEPIWDETIGNSDFPYSDGMVSILEQNIDEVSFSVSQLWNEAGVPMVAVYFTSSENESVCQMETGDSGGMILYESSETYTAECVMGYAEVGVYAYVGPADELNADGHSACSAPDDNYVGYYLTLSCTPVCETPIPNCLEEPLVVLSDVGHEESCMYDETPIMTETTDMNTDSVEFIITNTWPEDISALSVQFVGVDGELSCDTFENLEDFSVTSPIEASCSNGFAEVSVTIQSGNIDHVSQIIPETCNVATDVGTCTYEFIIPCIPDVDCDATATPSSPPTELPDHSPPVGPPIDCVELSNPLLKETTGNENFPYDENVLQILEQNLDDVKFSVSQILDESGVPMFACSC